MTWRVVAGEGEAERGVRRPAARTRPVRFDQRVLERRRDADAPRRSRLRFQPLAPAALTSAAGQRQQDGACARSPLTGSATTCSELPFAPRWQRTKAPDPA